MDYQNGKIYIIRNHINDLVYIGSTTQSLSKRFSWHKASMNTNKYQIYEAMNEIGIENFYIELLENYKCSCKDELHKKEGQYIRKYDSYKNGLNMLVAGRTDKEYRDDHKDQIKKYRDDHKDQIKKYNEEYYQVKKEKIKEQKKEYREVNKEKINQKIICECGGKYTHKNKSQHLKTNKHIEFIDNLLNGY